MDELVLRTVTRTSGANAALKDGTVVPQGFRFAFEEVPVLVSAFRRMVRELEYDVCEMALTTYLVAREHEVHFTALPIPLVRGFHHGAVQVLADSGVHGPADLVGRRVGVHRGYTVTTGVWARAVLQREHGLDLARVTWVLSGDEHVEAYRPPSNVVPAPTGRTLAELLRSGDVAAVVGADLAGDDIVPLLADPGRAALAALSDRGHWPINHVVVVRNALLQERPELAAHVFDAFARAKQTYVERLHASDLRTAADRTYRQVMDVTGADPLPYGLEPNRAVLGELLAAAREQRILRGRVRLDDVFAAGTRRLTA